MTTENTLYRIIFVQEDKKYEVYARYVSEESLMGFIEIEEIEFSEGSGVVVDPSEEKLRIEFENVKRSYIPMHLVVRIDEVEKRGAAKISQSEKKGNVHTFPGTRHYPSPPTSD